MSNDLAVRVLAAVEETEKIAQAAVGKLTGCWAVEPFEPSRPEAVPASAWVDDGDEGIAMVNGGYRAAHIAHHDPAATLRHCAADQRTVDEYALTVRLRDEARERLNAQGGNKVPADLDMWDRAQREASVLRPVIQRMARAYGITTEEDARDPARDPRVPPVVADHPTTPSTRTAPHHNAPSNGWK